MSALEDLLEFQLKAVGFKYEREFKPVPGRRFRTDFLIGNLCVEVEGGHWTGGRHTRGAGFEKDCEKYFLILRQGYRLLRVTGTHVKNGLALKWIDELLA